MIKRRITTYAGFLDLFLNIALGGMVLLFLAMLLISVPVPTNKKIDPKAELFVIMTWPDESPHDIDLWVQDPHNQIVSFRNKEWGLMHLERDDRGNSNDYIQDNEGNIVSVRRNQEVISIRGFIEGRWAINVHYYSRSNYGSMTDPTGRDASLRKIKEKLIEDAKNIPVQVQLVRINPYRIVYTATEILEEPNVEKHMFGFTVKKFKNEYSIHEVNKDSPVFLTGAALSE